MKEDQVVGHIPYNGIVVPIVSLFLKKLLLESRTREKINRGAGYGLEIPCVYQFYRPMAYIDKLREVSDALKLSGLAKILLSCRD